MLRAAVIRLNAPLRSAVPPCRHRLIARALSTPGHIRRDGPASSMRSGNETLHQHASSAEEVDKTGEQMVRWFKVLVIGWLSYKLFGIYMGSGRARSQLVLYAAILID